MWVIAPDCSFTVARQIGFNIGKPHRTGRLTADQQERLKQLLDRLGGRLPERLGGPATVNPRCITFSYRDKVTVLTLPPAGGDLAAEGLARGLLDLVDTVKEMIGS